ncbi:hypothetical protein LJC09_00855 [Desulfovibrio sp. OttesenSCG-928-F20]|nr:hypothetical protein [Desulfovibrio sp. OttesenSCG-928-M16]MDL2290642.1 hypothetical protein [Desulfovibrio sp. OttesenSCG-928-F20]
MLRLFLAVSLFVLCLCPPTWAGDFTTYWQVDGDWESCAFLDPQSEAQYYMAEHVRPDAPELIIFSLKTQYPRCDSFSAGAYLYGVEKRAFSLTAAQGHMAMGNLDYPFIYDLESQGKGFYKIRFRSFANEDLPALLKQGPVMALHFPQAGAIREVSLQGFTRALERAAQLCRAQLR